MNFSQNPGATTPSADYYLSLKSKTTAGVLAFVLGCMGVHHFYLGYIGRAIGHLVLFVVGLFIICFEFGTLIWSPPDMDLFVTCTFFIGIGFLFLLATGIWALVDGIMILGGVTRVDRHGRPLRL